MTSDLARERSDRENQVGELRSQLELREGQNEQTRSQLEGRIRSAVELVRVPYLCRGHFYHRSR